MAIENNAAEFKEVTRELRVHKKKLALAVKEMRRFLKEDVFIPDKVLRSVSKNLQKVEDTQFLIGELFEQWELGKPGKEIQEAELRVDEMFDRSQKLEEAREVLEFCEGFTSFDRSVDKLLGKLRKEMEGIELVRLNREELIKKTEKYSLLMDAYLEENPARKFELAQRLMPLFDQGIVLAVSLGLLEHAPVEDWWREESQEEEQEEEEEEEEEGQEVEEQEGEEGEEDEEEESPDSGERQALEARGGRMDSESLEDFGKEGDSLEENPLEESLEDTLQEEPQKEAKKKAASQKEDGDLAWEEDQSVASQESEKEEGLEEGSEDGTEEGSEESFWEVLEEEDQEEDLEDLEGEEREPWEERRPGERSSEDEEEGREERESPFLTEEERAALLVLEGEEYVEKIEEQAREAACEAIKESGEGKALEGEPLEERGEEGEEDAFLEGDFLGTLKPRETREGESSKVVSFYEGRRNAQGGEAHVSPEEPWKEAAGEEREKEGEEKDKAEAEEEAEGEQAEREAEGSRKEEKCQAGDPSGEEIAKGEEAFGQEMAEGAEEGEAQDEQDTEEEAGEDLEGEGAEAVEGEGLKEGGEEEEETKEKTPPYDLSSMVYTRWDTYSIIREGRKSKRESFVVDQFRKDLKRFDKVGKVVFFCFWGAGRPIFAAETFKRFYRHRDRDEEMDQVLSFLEGKGYVLRVWVRGFEDTPLYVGTQKLKDALDNKKVIKSLSLPEGGLYWDPQWKVMMLRGNVLVNVVLANFGCELLDRLTRAHPDVEDLQLVVEERETDGGFYVRLSPLMGDYDAPSYLNMFSCVTDCEEEVYRTLKNLEKWGSQYTPIVAVGAEKEKAKSLLRVVRDNPSIPHGKLFYLVYGDETFYGENDEPVKEPWDWVYQGRLGEEGEEKREEPQGEREAPEEQGEREMGSSSSEPSVSSGEEPSVSSSEEPSVSSSEEPSVSSSEEPSVSSSEEPSNPSSEEPSVSSGEEPFVSPSEEATVSSGSLTSSWEGEEILPGMEEGPGVEEVLEKTRELLLSHQYECACAFLAAASRMEPRLLPCHIQLGYALDDPMVSCNYSAQDVIKEFAILEGEEFEYCFVATALRVFFSDQYQYDYHLTEFYSMVSENQVISSFGPLQGLLFDLYQFKQTYHVGMEALARYHGKERGTIDKQLEEIQKQAEDLYKANFSGHKGEKSPNRQFIETRRILYDEEGNLGRALRAVMEDDQGALSFMETVLKEEYLKEGSYPKRDNLDPSRIDAVVDAAWAAAAKVCGFKKNSNNFIGGLRSKTVNLVAKVAGIVADYLYLRRELTRTQSYPQETIEAYAKAEAGILNALEACWDRWGDCGEKKEELEEGAFCLAGESEGGPEGARAAGGAILSRTLWEVHRKVEGSYQESEHKYFYLSFLCGDKVLLGEDFYPILDEVPDLPELSALRRILLHAACPKLDLSQRFENILSGEDDYGSAMLIRSYYEDTGRELTGQMESLALERIAREYPLQDMENHYQEFQEDIKLAQSNGLFDEVGMERMEAILQNVELWYEWARETMNYGFFRKILMGFRERVRAESRSRAVQLERDIEDYLSLHGQKDHLQVIEEIRRRIESMNYVAAEDLFNRLVSGDLETGEPLEKEDYLAAFLDNEEYTLNARKTADSGMNLSALLGVSHAHNKDLKGAERILTHWPSGRNTSEDQIRQLLQLLGFRVETCRKKDPIETSQSKIDNYFVKIQRPENGRRQNYKHPIAAFGSEAEEKGFRVVCLFGKIDASRLIDTFKEIGNAKHTLVLLDYALTLPDRRELARRTKTELSGKIFAVVDRIVIAFLVRHYTEQSVNRMLMYLIMPFASYQPYVVDSATVMPPEIFMGRKAELEKIESPYGVNIVYGGRQLGKSALLRMAKQDVDWNENGDRAVLVDVKNKDYQAAARAISRALVDEGVFHDESMVTQDWEELARYLKLRLQDKKNKLPYLLLMLDEADAFIESCEGVGYMPFDVLKDVQGIGQGRFKFVVAGLRNIIRFHRSKALGTNSGITHLGSLTVKPFKSMEARQLLTEPLTYLGFRFPKDRETEILISTILSTTNYFPGMIQLYCSKLIETMQRGYAGFAEAETPPYVVGKEQIKKVLNDQGLLDAIQEKFFVTIRLDNDDMYYIIALLVAYYYHQHKGEGCSSGDLLAVAQELNIGKLRELDEETVLALMQELQELNILQVDAMGKYRFTRLNFCQSLGTLKTIEDELINIMED